MERIVIRHLSGSKANQVEEFPLSFFSELIIGRDPAATVKYDLDKEGLVSREHAKIMQDFSDPTQFFITDLDSRNGTYVNKRRVVGLMKIAPGDVVQFGTKGPEFEFHVEMPVAPATRRLASPTLPLASDAQSRPRKADESLNASLAPEEADKGVSRKFVILGGVVLMALLAVAAGALIYRYIKPSALSRAGERLANNSGASAADATTSTGVPVGKLSGTSEAEKDPQRASWHIAVAPYLALGSGRPGNAADDFNRPEGVAFTPTGQLLATDAGNRRVQVWDVRTGQRLGEFGQGIFGGEIADITVAPNGMVLVTDQTLNLAYAFEPSGTGAYDYQFKGTRFGERGFGKIGGIAIDSRGRIYVVDASRNTACRFNPDGTPDSTWKFARARANGDTYLHDSAGVAIDEGAGSFFIASRKQGIVQVFDLETGAYKRQLIGANGDGSGGHSGKHVAFGPIEGLAVAQNHLLAVDERAGHIQVFDLSRPNAFNTDLNAYEEARQSGLGGYKGFVGQSPLVDFEGENGAALRQQAQEGALVPGQANPPGYFCSPDAVAGYTDSATGETYIAVADQGNYRLVVYRWSDIARNLELTANAGKGDLSGAGNSAIASTVKVESRSSTRRSVSKSAGQKINRAKRVRKTTSRSSRKSSEDEDEVKEKSKKKKKQKS